MAASVVFWQKYPLGVRQYKTIILGMPAAEKAGDSTGWAPPYNRVFEESKFFVYSLGDETMCISDDCGIGGYFVGCLGGWISGIKMWEKYLIMDCVMQVWILINKKLLRLPTKTLGL